MPSKVTATLLPARCEPIRVASDPATRGVTCRVAAFSTWLTATGGVTGGGGGGGAVTVRKTGTLKLPAAPALTMTVAREIPAVKVLVLAVTCTVASLVPDGGSKTSQPVPPW